MAPPPVNKSQQRNHQNNPKSWKFNLKSFIKKYITINYIKSLIFDPSKLGIVSVLILLAELILNILVVENVKYTEIDWIAYMQECGGFLNGTTNYNLLKGDTGPLVYPAGFLYIYSFLYYLTSHGQNIRLAQYLFIGIYMLQMWLVLRIYTKSRKLPPYVLVISAFTSYRIHSIYVLRLFNDPVAILFLYAAINFYLDGKWSIGSVFFSLGVSIKMNILLFAPAILLLYITNLKWIKTIVQLSICGIVQLILGAPFLFTYPLEYIRGSFDLGRIFEHKWTVNYRFLSRNIFENRLFHISLLTMHILMLLVFVRPAYTYMISYFRIRQLQIQLQPQIDAKKTDEMENRSKKSKKLNESSVPEEKQQQEEEKLTKEQQDFLNSFEKTIKKSTGNQKIKTEQKQLNEEVIKRPKEINEEYSVYYDKSVQLLLLPIFLSNFIGIVFARSLHYQFYVWYFHSLPYLIWCTRFTTSQKFLLLGVIEFAWNTYPSTELSSALLHLMHLIILYGIGKIMLPKIKIR